METVNKKPHSLTIKSETTITGVTQVVAIEEKEVKVAVGERYLLLTGKDFSAKSLSLDEGTLVLSGEVFSAKYAAKAEAKSLLKRIFK